MRYTGMNCRQKEKEIVLEMGRCSASANVPYFVFSQNTSAVIAKESKELIQKLQKDIWKSGAEIIYMHIKLAWDSRSYSFQCPEKGMQAFHL